ncbi:MAG: glycosyl transferase [Bacteroidetes bacterium GWE2_29_8]|nr:MAG: glycosyl transferase [Bacteroidetes bacterium GWE2_29_8]OFY22158.1 MAG: glycosyl transferase [Bacteroidetes bacterium GWF2_29_10]
MTKRIFDIIVSSIGLLLLSPLFFLVFFLIKIDSKGGFIYKQERIGCKETAFYLFKFRTMQKDSDKKGLLTIGGHDNRITRIGYYLRKYKIDELPQLLNVFIGNMSLVGPRPEVRKYVEMYTEEEKKVLSVKPGITDFASIKYIKESELLENNINPEEYYINFIMRDKLQINLDYIEKNNLLLDLKIIFRTILNIFA